MGDSVESCRCFMLQFPNFNQQAYRLNFGTYLCRNYCIFKSVHSFKFKPPWFLDNKRFIRSCDLCFSTFGFTQLDEIQFLLFFFLFLFSLMTTDFCSVGYWMFACQQYPIFVTRLVHLFIKISGSFFPLWLATFNNMGQHVVSFWQSGHMKLKMWT